MNLDLAALAHLGVENRPHLLLPSSLHANLPQELDEMLLVAMSFERDKRPPDCAVFGAQFEAVMKRYNCRRATRTSRAGPRAGSGGPN